MNKLMIELFVLMSWMKTWNLFVKNLNELRDKEEVLETLQNDIHFDFIAFFYHALLVTHRSFSLDFGNHFRGICFILLHHMGYVSGGHGKQ
jgi:hypothetical protein